MGSTVDGVSTAPNSYGIVLGTGNGDHIAGDSGSNMLQGSGGNDLYYGGAGNDTFVISAHSLATSSATTNGYAAESVVYDFQGAGGWFAGANDFINFSGFGAGSTLTFDHYGNSGGAVDQTMQYYTIHDAGTGADYTLYIHSLDGHLLGKGDYNFY